jgi:3-hydroxyisobutyrate dehydrogenase-like beta-hydroxyacid dehydrogenase
LDSRAGLVAQSDVVLSICPPHAAESVAAAMADSGFAGIYMDANPISPQRNRDIATRLAANGARVVDGGIIGPAEAGPGALRLYLSGEAAAMAVVVRLFVGADLTVTSVSGGVGAASALKLAYSLSQKAGRALAALSYALAERHTVAGELRAVAESMKNNPLSDPEYLAVAASRGWRWVAEMSEISDSLTAAGLPGRLPLEAGDVFARWAELKDSEQPDLSLVLKALSEQTTVS